MQPQDTLSLKSISGFKNAQQYFIWRIPSLCQCRVYEYEFIKYIFYSIVHKVLHTVQLNFNKSLI